MGDKVNPRDDEVRTRGAARTPCAGLRVGLLGGSFNPAHDGHRRISLMALRWLALDEVWWLVSPQNPLKLTADMAPLSERMASAQACAQHRRIRVSDLEASLASDRSHDTMRHLRRIYPRMRFVWIIGADNLLQLPRWHRWRDLVASVPIAVFDRPTFSYAALASQAASQYRRHRLPARLAPQLANQRPPAWVFLWPGHDSTSATAIRQGASGPRRSGVDS